jgi:hypothetical protein
MAHNGLPGLVACFRYRLPTQFAQSKQKMNEVGTAAAPMASFVASSSSSSSVTEDGLRKLTRSEERAAQQLMAVGKKFRVKWRYGPSAEAEASPVMEFEGTVVETETDEEGCFVTLVEYKPHPEALPNGGILTFPPPPLTNRQVELFEVCFLRAPSAIPNLTAFVRPPPAQAQLEAQSAQRGAETARKESEERPRGGRASSTRKESEERTREKRPREEADDNASMAAVDAISRIADRLEGSGEKMQVVDGLKIPRNIRDMLRPFYPNLWVGRPQEWSAALTESTLQMGVRFTAITVRENFYSQKNSLAVLLGSERSPRSKAEWLPLFHIAAVLFGLCVLGAGGQQQKADMATSQVRNQFELGYINIPALWAIAQDQLARRGHEMGQRGGRGRGGGRGGGRGRGTG